MYNINKINDNSYSQIQILQRESFGNEHSILEIEKKYNTSVFGLKNIGILAEDKNGSPAAYYGVFPITLWYESKDYVVAQSGDTMTAPNHRKKGLFITLANETYKLAKKEGIKLIFGFPNENSYSGFKKKLNWIFYGSMQKFTINNLAIPFCEIASRNRYFEQVYRKFVNYRISKYTLELNEKNISCFESLDAIGEIKKDLNYFKYKLDNNEKSMIKINDFSLLIKSKPHLIIGAVGYFEKSQTKELIKTVKKLSKILGCKKAVFILSKNHWLFNYLIEEITPSDSLPIGFYLVDDSLKPKNIQFTYADYDTF